MKKKWHVVFTNISLSEDTHGKNITESRATLTHREWVLEALLPSDLKDLTVWI